jgi:hypothetical protein
MPPGRATYGNPARRNVSGNNARVLNGSRGSRGGRLILSKNLTVAIGEKRYSW